MNTVLNLEQSNYRAEQDWGVSPINYPSLFVFSLFWVFGLLFCTLTSYPESLLINPPIKVLVFVY